MTRDHSLTKLGLGTVQFGQAYGISNQRGRVPQRDVGAILRRAAAAGMNTLDTAAGYGDAEQVLGDLEPLTRPFRIVTKTIGLKSGGIGAVLARARRSAHLLRRHPIDLLLVHSAGELASPDGPALWSALLALRDEGLCRAIGISAYVDDDPVALAKRFRPTAMQVPVSVLDQRLLRSGVLSTLKSRDIEVHARSLFLQGLLFLSADRLPPRLAHIAGDLNLIRARLKDAGLTPLEGALAFARTHAEIDVALVGVSAPSELDEILAASYMRIPTLDWNSFALNDPLVLTPSRW